MTHPANTPASGGDEDIAIATARDEYERWSTAYSSGEPQGRRAWVCRHDDDGQWRPTTYHGSEGEASDACHEEALAASVRAALAAPTPKPPSQWHGGDFHAPKGFDQQETADAYNDWLITNGFESSNPHPFATFVAGMKHALAAQPPKADGGVVQLALLWQIGFRVAG